MSILHLLNYFSYMLKTSKTFSVVTLSELFFALFQRRKWQSFKTIM